MWRRLGGLYGFDAVSRKYGEVPPDEWVQMIGGLSDAQVANGLEKLFKEGVKHCPSLPEFINHCRDARNWGPIRDLPYLPDPKSDGWVVAGNVHLMAYVRRNAGNRRYFNSEQTMNLVAWKNAWVRDVSEEAGSDGLDVKRQKEMWADCMARAEASM